MSGQHIRFASLSWDGWASGAAARVKLARADDQQVRLVEIGPGFVEPHWCENGHVGYVVSGEYVTDLDDDTWTLRAGEGFILPTGIRHRSRNTGSLPAVVFLFDLATQEPEAAQVTQVTAEGQAEA